MPTPGTDLTATEWKIMRIVWQRKSCAARDVCEDAGRDYGWSVSTVKTLLRRLVEKGYLSATQIGNSFLYRPARPALKSLVAAADDLMFNAVSGLLGPVLQHMVRKADLSDEQIAQLKAMLEDRTRGQEEGRHGR